MLRDFLEDNQKEILLMTEEKSFKLAGGAKPSSGLLKSGLPIFFEQLKEILLIEEGASLHIEKNKKEIVKASIENDEAALAKSAGEHGAELMRLGYSLSYTVHAYGSMCQSITELATKKKSIISNREFHDLNRCLDIAIAGAVTKFQLQKNTEAKNEEMKHLGFLAHELRNSMMSIKCSMQMIKKGTFGFAGNTGKILEDSLNRMQTLIDQSLTQVRLRVDPIPHIEDVNLLQLVDQIILGTESEAIEKKQTLEVNIDPGLTIEVDHQFLYSALSNLIQNALKYTRVAGKIEVRGHEAGEDVVIEVEDECGGLSNTAVNLFKPFEQQNENKSGLGLGLTIAQRAILLNKGKIEVNNLPKKGCVFKITLPKATHSEVLH